MLRYGWSPIAWSAVYFIILLSFITPFSVFTAFLIMVPALIIYITTSPKCLAICMLSVYALTALLTGNVGVVLVLIGLFFLVPSLIMGYLYKKQTDAHLVVTGGIVTLIVILLLAILAISLTGSNVTEGLGMFLMDSFLSVPEVLRQGITEEMMQELIFYMTRMIPLYVIMFAAFYAIITHVVARQVLKRTGMNLQKMIPIKKWMLPRTLLWYYLVAMLLEMFVEWDKYSMVAMILLNLIPLLTLVFAVQAVSFLFFIADAKKWNKAVPFLGIIPAVLFPTLISWIGVLDVAFKMRERVKKS